MPYTPLIPILRAGEPLPLRLEVYQILQVGMGKGILSLHNARGENVAPHRQNIRDNYFVATGAAENDLHE